MARTTRIGLLLAALWAIATPASARAAESLPILIADDFTSTLVGIHYSGSPQVAWTVPADTHRVGLQVWGGRGVSDEPWSHGFGALPVAPGEMLVIEFGGPGMATSVRRGGELLIAAAGADGGSSHLAPFLEGPWMVREGGGEAEREGMEEGVAEHGRVVVHYRPAPPEPPVAGPGCRIPSLVGKRPKDARRALVLARCTIGTIVRRPSPPRQRGRVKRQSQAPGTLLPREAPVDLVVGRRPYSGATPR